MAWRFLVVIVFGLAAFNPAVAEFYRYTDESGQVHFVDDVSKIPQQTQGGMKTYRERYDHLPAADRERIQREQAIANEARARENQERLIQILEISRKEREAYLAKKRPSGDETPFTLKNNQVLVPVTFGYGRTAVETVLLLDTGASVTALHSRAVQGLNLQGLRKARARTAGGGVIDTRLARFDYIQVGPHRIADFSAVILDFEGAAVDHQGLLGMDFLGRFPHGIDMARQVIQWAPR